MAIDSQYIFDYLNDVWDLLPEEDQIRFGALWKSYEQTYGSIWIQQFDSDLGNTIQTLPLYNILRWIKHFFNDDTQVLRAATFTSAIDYSTPIDLSARYLIKIGVDGNSPVEMDLRGLNPSATSLAEIVAKINTLIGQPIASATDAGKLLTLTSTIKGPASSLSFFPASNPAHDGSELVLGLDPTISVPLVIPTYPYAYQLADARVVGVPTLQDHIRPDVVITTLTQNVDYVVEFGTGIITFKAPPPAEMWAPDTLINYETPYNNFGYLMGIYSPNTPDYLKAVKGLWFAFWNGPRPENIRRALYLLFGLPTASKIGSVTSVTDTQIAVVYTDGTTETFKIPNGLKAVVSVGENLTQFQPLVTGINVYDKVNYPGFLRKEIGRPAVEPFLTQFATRGPEPDTDESMALILLEETTYLPQINVDAFISPNINLSNVNTFLREIQPRSRTYLTQIIAGVFFDPIPLMDEGLTTVPTPSFPNGQPALQFAISFDVTPNVDWNNNTMADSQTLIDEDNPYTWIRLNDEYILMRDSCVIEVYQSAVLIDTITVEG